jgi:hypothetical protein
MKIRSVLVFLLGLAVMAMTLQAQTYTLRYDFRKGEAYRFRDNAAIADTREMGGQEMKSTSSLSGVTRMVVENRLDDGSIVCVVSSDSMVITVKSPMMDTTMTLAALLGKRTRITSSQLGVVGAREIVDTVKLQGMMRAMAQRESFTLHRLPEKPVAIGGTWHATVSDTASTPDGSRTTTSDLDYTVAGVETRGGADCLTITYKGTLTFSGKGKMRGMEFFMEGTGNIKGTMSFDPKRGLPVEDVSTREAETTIAFTGEQNMTMPSTQTVKMTRTLIQE